MKGSFPSTSHAGYRDEQEAKTEVQRLETLRLEKNHKIETSPAKGFSGACFLNVKDEKPWSYKEIESNEN